MFFLLIDVSFDIDIYGWWDWIVKINCLFGYGLIINSARGSLESFITVLQTESVRIYLKLLIKRNPSNLSIVQVISLFSYWNRQMNTHNQFTSYYQQSFNLANNRDKTISFL